MTTETEWTRTRHGGFRRQSNAGSSARIERHPEKVEDGSADGPGSHRSKRTVGNVATDSAGSPLQVAAASRRTGFKSLPAYKWLKSKFTIKMNERLGLPTCPYVIRWRIETPWGSVRLHHWLAPDDDRARHDHPWSFTTFVLKGGYTDLSPDGDEHLRAPAIRHRAATHQHTVVPDQGGAWTVIVTGPKIRNWGFWVKGKFVKMNKYFLTYGHHPCD